MDADDELYRRVIDALVDDCRSGQGQIGVRRARAGVWNANATPTFLPDQYEVNVLLDELSAHDRETVGRLLAGAFEGGVFAALRVLYEAQAPPFDRSYEGTPFNDFIGRLDGWAWPEDGNREP